jgi:hypothetical protein
MDLTTNSVGMADWIRATKNVVVNAYDLNLKTDTTNVQSTQKADLVSPIQDPQLPLALQA